MKDKMIFEDEMISEILKSIPDFLPILQKEMEYWSDKDEFPIGLQLAEFTEFVFQHLRKEKKEIVLISFNIIEYLLINGDRTVKNYIYFMFLESLMNVLENNGYDLKIIEPYLGPFSRKAYDRINAFWLEGKPIESLD